MERRQPWCSSRGELMERGLRSRPSDQKLDDFDHHQFIIIITTKNLSHPSHKWPKVEPRRCNEEEDEDEHSWSGLTHHSLTAPCVTWKKRMVV